MYKSAMTSPTAFQWETSSGSIWASQSNNCGPSCVTKIARFYLDNANIGIENTRRLIVGCCSPTTASQQAQMLTARGVPATAQWIDSLEQIDALVGWDGTRPIIIGVEMSRVPVSTRDHGFLGWHAIVIMSRAINPYNGMQGYWVFDPNFAPGSGPRSDPDHGKKFYYRSTLQYAYIDNWVRWSVIPNKKKQVFVNIVAAGDPAVERVRFINETGTKIKVKANKPFRTGASIHSPVIKRFDTQKTLRLTGIIKKEDMDKDSKPYGPAWFGPIFRSNGESSLAYVMDYDKVDGSHEPI